METVPDYHPTTRSSPVTGPRPAERQVPFVDLPRQVAALEGELKSAMWSCCQRADFILGAATEQFEQAFAQYLEVPYAVGVANGLDALRLVLTALGVGPGDEVITAANTFIATALAISATGARPVLVDCDPRTMNLDPNHVEAAITPRTRAILPVHFAGRSADMASLAECARRHQLPIVEDACQAHGSRYGGQRCGSFGIASCFSFYPGKNLGAFGDGGLIATHDQNLFERVRCLRHYGQAARYHHVERGVNSRLDTLQAAVLQVKLPHLDAWNAARQRHAACYEQRLSGVGDLLLPAPAHPGEHVYHLYMVETSHRDRLRQFLAQSGVQTGIHYPVPIHLQPAYANLGYSRGDFPIAEQLAERILSLPMFPELTLEEIDYVCDRVRQSFEVST